MTQQEVPNCFICDHRLDGFEDLGGVRLFLCPRCGPWMPLQEAGEGVTLREILDVGDNQRTLRRKANLSKIVRRQQASGKTVGVPLGRLDSWDLEAPLSSPFEQLDELVLWAGDNQSSPTEPTIMPIHAMSAWLGVALDANRTAGNFVWLYDQKEAKALVNVWNNNNNMFAQLSINGWQHYHQIKKARIDSKFAFMAMKFGDEELDGIFLNCFSPAVAKTGFELRRLIDRQGAGLIDDQMRVALQTCRFVLADLTHANPGAYWEAGFAEGLAKPVIYTCRLDIWDKEKSHFDTNHMATIIWNPKDLAKAATQLTAMVRATLPAEAIMSD